MNVNKRYKNSDTHSLNKKKSFIKNIMSQNYSYNIAVCKMNYNINQECIVNYTIIKEYLEYNKHYIRVN